MQHTIEKALILSDGAAIDAAALQLRETSRPASESATLEEMERRMIAEAIEACGGNLSMVARRLGLTRQTLYNKIKRYGL